MEVEELTDENITSEERRIIKMVKRICELAEPSPYVDEDEKLMNDKSAERIRKALLKLGFQQFESRRVFIGQNIVIKEAYTIGRQPEKSLPTMKLENGWSVQPKCLVMDKFKQEHWEDLMEKGLARCYHVDKDGVKHYTYGDNVKRDGYGMDIHRGNLGLYKGELVAHDW